MGDSLFGLAPLEFHERYLQRWVERSAMTVEERVELLGGFYQDLGSTPEHQ